MTKKASTTANRTVSVGREAANALRRAAKGNGMSIQALGTECLLGHPRVWEAYVEIMGELGQKPADRPAWVEDEGLIEKVPVSKRRTKIYGKILE